MFQSRKARVLFASLACLIGIGGIYFATLAPTVQGFDSAELTIGAVTLGLVHPTGYPLYMLLGHAAAQFPLGEVGFRLNLLSALLGALSAWLLFTLVLAQTQNTLTSIIATAFFALAPHVWMQAIKAEVYTLQTLLVISILLTWWVAHHQDQPPLAIVYFALLGLACANHATTLFLGLVLLFNTDWREPRWRAYSLLGILVGAGGAALLYLYFPWRASQPLLINYIQEYFQRDPRCPLDLLWLISGQAFRCAVQPAASLQGWFTQALRFATFLWDGSSGLAPILGIWGWIELKQLAPRWNRLLTLYFLGNMAFFVTYQVVDKEAMFLPVYLILNLWIAQGILGFAAWLSRRLPRLHASHAVLLTNLALACLLAVGVSIDWPALDLSQDRLVHSYATQVLQEVPPNTTIVNHWATASVFDYLRIVEGNRPDITSFNLDFYFLGIQSSCQPDAEQLTDMRWYSWIDMQLQQQIPLCFIEPLPSIPDKYHWTRRGSCWEMSATK